MSIMIIEKGDNLDEWIYSWHENTNYENIHQGFDLLKIDLRNNQSIIQFGVKLELSTSH